MSKPGRPYADTAVSIDRSVAEVMAQLRTRNATGLQFTEEGNRSTLRFMWRSTSGAELCARFVVEVKPMKWRGRTTPTSKQIAEMYAQEKRRLFRVLVYFIKNLFEAVDGGLLSIEQALLPHLEAAGGQTLGELLVPRLHQLRAGPLARALGAPALEAADDE